MKTRIKKRRLMIQITVIVLPLFMLLTVIICQQVYQGSIDSFLEAQNVYMQEHINNSEKNFFLFDEQYDCDELRDWYIDCLEKKPSEMITPLTEDEEKRIYDYFDIQDTDDGNIYLKMPEDIRELCVRRFYSLLDKLVVLSDNYDSLFVMDVTEGSRGKILLDLKQGRKGLKTGDSYDIDIDDHPAIKSLINSSSSEFKFERNSDFPDKGENYIGCKSIVINGKTRVIIGITYNWNSLRKALHGTIIRTMLISISGMHAVMAVIMILLYRRAVDPVRRIQNALIAYTDDKDTRLIVEQMLEIKEKNEMGYLADSISDLAIEIETYTKKMAQAAAEHERAEKDLYEARVSIMVSQIQPHFMYNALSSIAMMCEIDPEAAQETTITFAKYLRGNMDSLKQTKPVPFTKELEHLKNYIYIEKVRFADRLNVEYDIQADNFELPLLSIQPLVENAIKHGISRKKQGGTVTIATRETNDAFEVIVSDDGVGFDTNAPKQDDGRSHVGMENTEKRLKDMCNADLIIESEIGKGTTAKVTIPKIRKEDEDK